MDNKTRLVITLLTLLAVLPFQQVVADRHPRAFLSDPDQASAREAESAPRYYSLERKSNSRPAQLQPAAPASKTDASAPPAVTVVTTVFVGQPTPVTVGPVVPPTRVGGNPTIGPGRTPGGNTTGTPTRAGPTPVPAITRTPCPTCPIPTPYPTPPYLTPYPTHPPIPTPTIGPLPTWPPIPTPIPYP